MSLLNIIGELKKCCNHPFLFESAEDNYRGSEEDKSAVRGGVRRGWEREERNTQAPSLTRGHHAPISAPRTHARTHVPLRVNKHTCAHACTHTTTCGIFLLVVHHTHRRSYTHIP